MQTQIKEEFYKAFPQYVAPKNLIPGMEISLEDWWLDKIQSALAEQREEIVKMIEDIIQKERFSGAPHALNEIITTITNLNK